MDKEELKKIYKEAIKEWLDECFAEFGKWTLMSLGAAFIAALTYFTLKMNGWTLK